MKKIEEISIKNNKTKKRDQMNSYVFPKGRVSLYSIEVRNAVNNIEIQGICMKRFKADIVTSGLDYLEVEVDDMIKIGDLEIVVTQSGKPCHSSHCIAYNEDHQCIMQSGVIFGEVLVPGKVSVGDSFV